MHGLLEQLTVPYEGLNITFSIFTELVEVSPLYGLILVNFKANLEEVGC